MRIGSLIRMNAKGTAESAAVGRSKPSRSQATLRSSRHHRRAKFEFALQYRALFENNPLPMWIIDRRNLSFLAANRAAVRRYGYSKSEFTKMTVLDLHPIEERPGLRKSLSMGWEPEPSRASYLSQHLKKNGKLIEVEVRAESLTLFGRRVRLAVAINITERKEAESRAESLAKFPDENPNPALRVSRDGMVTYHNKPSTALLRAWSYVKGSPLTGKWFHLVRLAYDSGTEQQEEIRCGNRIFSIMLAPIPNSGYVNIYALDITERKRLERAVLEISEQEQRRIGQEMHDHLNQQLAGIKYLTDVLGKRLARKVLPEAAEAARVSELLNQAIQDARSLAHGLFPVKLQADGLATALQDFARTMQDTYKVSCRFICNQPVPLSDNGTATHLFRIAQEATRNAVRHGKAPNVLIRLDLNRGAVWLTIKNDGRNFPLRLAGRKGMGLEIMKQRALASGGKLEIHRAPGGGTIVVCKLRAQIT